MRILAKQLVPGEFAHILSGDTSIISEGVAISFANQARDIQQAGDFASRRFARLLGQKMGADDEARRVAMQVSRGAIAELKEVRKHVLDRIFSANLAERTAFVQGLHLGNSLPLLLEQRIADRTSSTDIYLMLWLYWPEVNRMRSLGEVSRMLAPILADKPNMARTWDDRFRKLANRLRLSFQRRQKRRKRV